MLGQPTEAVERATIVEEAEGGVEFGLAQLGQSLPDVLGHDVALAVLRCLVLVDFTASDEDLREVRVYGEAEGGPGDPHLSLLFEFAIDDFMS